MKISVGLGLVFLAVFLAVLFQFSAPRLFGAPKETIVVNLTTSESQLIAKLKAQGYIRSEWAFNFVLRQRGWQGKIQPAGYAVSKGMPAWELADVLVNHPSQKWVVIPEGLRKEEVAEIIQKTLAWPRETKQEFLDNSQEGYLFPETYLLDLDSGGREVARRMTAEFNEKVADLFKKAREKNIRNDTLVVLASLVQREAASQEEMPLIASVIWNRWLKGMPFQIDATVQYALGKQGDWWPKIRSEDYQTVSPYNTYLHLGRPPEPIANPGRAALAAVIDFPESDYLYYLHDSQGQIHLAKTYETPGQH